MEKDLKSRRGGNLNSFKDFFIRETIGDMFYRGILLSGLIAVEIPLKNDSFGAGDSTLF